MASHRTIAIYGIIKTELGRLDFNPDNIVRSIDAKKDLLLHLENVWKQIKLALMKNKSTIIKDQKKK